MKLSYYLFLLFVSISFTVAAQHQHPFQVYKENDRYGLKNAKKEIIVKPIYLNIKTSKFGVFAMQTENRKWAIFDKEGIRVTDFIYDRMEQELPNVIEVRQGSKVGLVAEDGKQLVRVDYDKIAPVGKVILSQNTAINNSMQPKSFQYRGAIVTKNNITGFINTQNKLILPIDNERVKATAKFDLKNGFIDVVGLIVTKNGQFGIVDETGKTIIPFQYNYINALNRLGFGELEQNNKTGLYDAKLSIIVAPTFDEISILNEKLFAGKNGNSWKIFDIKNPNKVYATVSAVYPFSNGFTRIKKGKKWSVLSAEGIIKLGFEYDEIVPFGRNLLLKKDGKYFIFTSKGKVKPYEFSTIISWRNLNDKLKPAQTTKGKYGYINDDGTFVIAAKYDDAKDFREGVAIVKKDNLYGFIDEQGKLIQPIKYQIPNVNMEYTVLLVQSESLYGYINYQGKILIDCQYEAIAFYDDFMRAKLNGKYGWIDKNGKQIIPFQFDFIENYDEHKKQFRYQKGNKLGWINRTLTKNESQSLVEWADEIELTKNKVRNIRVGNYFGLINENQEFIIPVRYENKLVFDKFGKAIVKENQLWGMIDKGGNVVIPSVYQEQFRFDDNQLACVLKNGKYGVVDYDGNVLVTMVYDSYIYTDYEYWTVKKNNKFGITNSKGQLIIPIEYEKVFPYINHLALAKKDGKWGYINEINQPVIPFEYQVLNSFIDGRAIAKKGDYWGIINTDNEVILDFKFDNLIEETNGFISASKQGFWGIIDESYQTVVPFKYDKITTLNSYFRIEKNDKIGLYSIDGQLILPAFYDALTIDGNGFKIQKDGKSGLLDFDGNVLIPVIYDELMYFNSGISRVKKGNKYGMITAEGKLIIPCNYDNLGIRFTGEYIEAAKDEQYGILNKNGKTVTKFQYEKIRWKNGNAEGLKNGNWLKIAL
ncbi:MAG: WG repeat-containing protein [Saprospiraceae bacterium]